MRMYVGKDGLDGNAEESSRTGAKVTYVIALVLELNLGVEAGNVFVNYVNLIFGVSPDHSSLFFQRVTTENRRLALLYH